MNCAENQSLNVRATAQLVQLHTELLKCNSDWDSAQRRDDMNHFMARLIVCFFANDLSLAPAEPLQVSSSCWGSRLPSWDGWLFEGQQRSPVFSESANACLCWLGELDWKKISPTIFGAILQTVTDAESRGALGMHYTSVPNILKLLNPLFLDGLNEQLCAAGDQLDKLEAVRRRLSQFRVFDPACGSGNFLVVAYEQLRAIELKVNERCSVRNRSSAISLSNFFGIELLALPAKIAQIALNVAALQCERRALPGGEGLASLFKTDSRIVCGNALRLDWQMVCPPMEPLPGNGALGHGETYICGNPPFKGSRKQQAQEKEDLKQVFSGHTKYWKNVDYAGAWLLKAAVYNQDCVAPFAFVATNSLCQGQQVPITWAVLGKLGFAIRFAHTSFKWANLASKMAEVTVVIVGLDSRSGGTRWLISEQGRREVRTINPYLTEHSVNIVRAARKPLFSNVSMQYGVYYSKSGALILTRAEKDKLLKAGLPVHCVRRFIGSTQFINGKERYCLWLSDDQLATVGKLPGVRQRINQVRRARQKTTDREVNKMAARPHQFRERKGDEPEKIFVPIVCSEQREYFPVGMADESVIPTNKAFYVPNGPLWVLAVLVSKLHLTWIATVCGRLEMRFSYSNTLGWNTFPLPKLSAQNRAALSACAEAILSARQSHRPASLAELYEPSQMPANLRRAHERNDEVLDGIYIGRRFRGDHERLETLFELYARKTESSAVEHLSA